VVALVPVPDAVDEVVVDDDVVTVPVVSPAPLWVPETVVPQAEHARTVTIERPAAIHGALYLRRRIRPQTSDGGSS
jgi:hypothetical protein